jgi:hypothetical protein
VTVYRNGTPVRTMPTSMGMGGTQQVNGRNLSFWTRPGIYTVLDKGNPVVMDSSTFGLPKNSRLGYRETINYATRISIDGIYLHELEATAWAQGNTDTSHGCLNLNADNATVLRLLPARRCRRSAQHRRATAGPTTERRLDHPMGPMAQGQRLELTNPSFHTDQRRHNKPMHALHSLACAAEIRFCRARLTRWGLTLGEPDQMIQPGGRARVCISACR